LTYVGGQVTFAISPLIRGNPLARKILLADDSVTAQNMGRKILADAGYEVVAVNNGSAALKRIAEQRPDLIVLDVYMPGYSGLEVCARLKETNETARIPILLTVGKLEPFKPEEAKRVRADGFIVKPFEASELLSALTKLEDKIVPVSEGSKPGRFARTIAAVEEGRYDKTVSGNEESGWKNRISFPSKKKAKEKDHEHEETDDAAIYNPVNKDLRTVVDRSSRKPAEENLGDQSRADHARVDHSRVDLGALAPEGLPKDVTPEEIAALAAAAARVSGVVAETKLEEKNTDEKKLDESKISATPPGPVSSTSDEKILEAVSIDAKVQTAVEAKAEIKTEAGLEKSPDRSNEAKAESQPSAEASTASTFAPIAALQPETASADAAKVAMPPIDIEVASTSAAHEPVSRSREFSSDEPVTMAVAAGAESSWRPSRWTAVAVALAPEESVLSLETEMQKTGAAVAVAEPAEAKSPAVLQSAPPASDPIPVPFIPVAPVDNATPLNEAVANESARIEAAKAESAKLESEKFDSEKLGSEKLEKEKTETEPTAPAMPQLAAEPVAAPAPVSAPFPVSFVEAAIAEVASLATEAVSAAVKQFEKVTGSQPDGASAPSGSAPTPAPELADKPVRDMPTAAESKAESIPAVASATPEIDPPGPEASAAERSVYEKPAAEFAVFAELEKIQERAAEPAPFATANELEGVASPSISAVPAQADISDAPAGPVKAETEAAASAATYNPIAGGAEDMAKKESEVATTAAGAWASWRRIRDVGDKGAAPQPDSGNGQVSAKDAAFEREASASAESQDKAAMAAAAGAEKAPEEAAAPVESEPAEIASIVDSVLADLRPKIVEEISKKLGKRK
jgi:CheY-like chemotaxis protein